MGDKEGQPRGSRGSKRGQYASYGPTLTAEIADQVAKTKGCVVAVRAFFKDKYDIDIPESTVRNIKKRQKLPIDKEAGGEAKAKRGRRLALGSHEQLVRDTVAHLGEKYSFIEKNGQRPLFFLNMVDKVPVLQDDHDENQTRVVYSFPVQNGEKISSFLAIATAKEVLMKQEPTLLEEFGGKVSLNMDWAKAFMRRHGFNNSTIQAGREDPDTSGEMRQKKNLTHRFSCSVLLAALANTYRNDTPYAE